jgi:hypothetical protein
MPIPSFLRRNRDEGSMTVYIGRREFLGALGGTAIAWPFGARASTQRQELVSAAKTLELTTAEADVNRPDGIENAVEALANAKVDIVKVDVVIVLQTGFC